MSRDGIEPPHPGLHSEALPTELTRPASLREDSNPGPADYETAALPLSYEGISHPSPCERSRRVTSRPDNHMPRRSRRCLLEGDRGRVLRLIRHSMSTPCRRLLTVSQHGHTRHLTVEPVPGLEPDLAVWKTAVQPTHPTGKWREPNRHRYLANDRLAHPPGFHPERVLLSNFSEWFLTVKCNRCAPRRNRTFDT